MPEGSPAGEGSRAARGSEPGAEALRLFVALDLPAEHRREIGRRAAGLRGALPPARWVRPEAMHLTLAFLGDTPAARVDDLTAALAPAFAAAPPLELALAGAGTFPPRRPARVAWVGIAAPPALPALQRRVAGAVAEALGGASERQRGSKPERKPFHAHVTVARPRRRWNRGASERFAAAFETPVGEPFTVREGVLYRSELDPGGAIYSPLARFPLDVDGGTRAEI
jgi:2'-5' RNA ligase